MMKRKKNNLRRIDDPIISYETNTEGSYYVYSDGAAEYHRRIDDIDNKTLSFDKVDELLEAFETYDFFSMLDEYEGNSYYGQPTVYELSYNYHGKKKRVKSISVSNVPSGFWRISEQIKSIVNQADLNT